MYDIESWDSTITAFLNFLGLVSWPIVVLIIVCIFRLPISKLLANLKTVKWKDLIFEFDDKIKVFSPIDNKFHDVTLQPTPAEKARKAEISRLSAEEIEQSRQKALQRLAEDTKRTGYQRGKLYQTDSGKWAIAWNLEVGDGIVLSDSK